MKSRRALDLVRTMADQFPAVLILGPRQSGKTTLARSFIHGSYYDLERPSDHDVFVSDPELALSRLPEPLILDEAQMLPELFSVLRPIIDENRRATGRFYLLGSVNPSLLQSASESLAGRIGTVELTPFLSCEVDDELDLDDHWLRGGYPDACLEDDAVRRVRWYEQFIVALVQRDLSSHRLGASATEMRRFLGMVAHTHGGLQNASELGRSLGVSYHTASRYLDILEGHFLVRRLTPWHANLGKRLVRSPKLYVRDTGLLHYLLGIRSEVDLLQSPRRGASWEGLLVEQIIALERLARVGSSFWFFRTQAGAEIDLVIDRGDERIGLEFKCALSADRSDASGIGVGLADGVITRGLVVHAGSRRYPLSDRIEAVPALEILTDYERTVG